MVFSTFDEMFLLFWLLKKVYIESLKWYNDNKIITIIKKINTGKILNLWLLLFEELLAECLPLLMFNPPMNSIYNTIDFL